jgi:Icc-related predicted phosphoesterase
MKFFNKKLLFLGDIHGNFNYVKWYIETYKLDDCLIVQVGDFGIGFNTKHKDMDILTDLDNFLNRHKINMVVWRGNHDNPKFFDGHLSNHFNNLHLLLDYTVIDVDGVKILGVGGAISIDRISRLHQMEEAARYGRNIELYWQDEVFVLDEEKLKTFEGIDIVVTHTAPDFCAPDNKNGFGYLVDQFAQGDPKLYDDLREERTLLTKMYEILKEKNNLDYWFYAHYHRSWTGNIEGINYRLLDINEFYGYRNWKNYESEWEKDLN